MEMGEADMIFPEGDGRAGDLGEKPVHRPARCGLGIMEAMVTQIAPDEQTQLDDEEKDDRRVVSFSEKILDQNERKHGTDRGEEVGADDRPSRVLEEPAEALRLGAGMGLDCCEVGVALRHTGGCRGDLRCGKIVDDLRVQGRPEAGLLGSGGFLPFRDEGWRTVLQADRHHQHRGAPPDSLPDDFPRAPGLSRVTGLDHGDEDVAPSDQFDIGLLEPGMAFRYMGSHMLLDDVRAGQEFDGLLFLRIGEIG